MHKKCIFSPYHSENVVQKNERKILRNSGTNFCCFSIRGVVKFSNVQAWSLLNLFHDRIRFLSTLYIHFSQIKISLKKLLQSRIPKAEKNSNFVKKKFFLSKYLRFFEKTPSIWLNLKYKSTHLTKIHYTPTPLSFLFCCCCTHSPLHGNFRERLCCVYIWREKEERNFPFFIQHTTIFILTKIFEQKKGKMEIM